MAIHDDSRDLIRIDLLRTLFGHPIYEMIQSVPDLQVFMREHVFAVWDFMSLAKRLQRDVTSTSLPWLPPENRSSARLINEIVLGEESDEDGLGGFCSHLELYLSAMDDIGADRDPIDRFLAALASGCAVPQSLREAPLLPSTVRFVNHNIDLAHNGESHEVAAAFCYGREDIIPRMFQRMLPAIRAEGNPVQRFLYYLERHIELDGDHHGPMSEQLLRSLIGNDPKKQVEARRAGEDAIRSRVELWDGIADQLNRAESDRSCINTAVAP